MNDELNNAIQQIKADIRAIWTEVGSINRDIPALYSTIEEGFMELSGDIEGLAEVLAE